MRDAITSNAASCNEEILDVRWLAAPQRHLNLGDTWGVWDLIDGGAGEANSYGDVLGSAIWRPGRVSGRVAIGQGARTVQEHSRAAIRALARLSLTQSRRGARYSIDDLKFLDDEVRWRCRMYEF